MRSYYLFLMVCIGMADANLPILQRKNYGSSRDLGRRAAVWRRRSAMVPLGGRLWES